MRYLVALLGAALMVTAAAGAETVSSSQPDANTQSATSGLRFDVLAGGGAPGVDDGRGSASRWLMPAAVAVDRTGTIYVADAGAQRIRTIDRSGTVRTIAGGGPLNSSGLYVDGGYEDGPANVARFNRPEGLAIGPDGSLYIADLGNHCIRILKASVVSTFAGVCGEQGSANGAKGTGLLWAPRGIAFDDAGNLWVADYMVGLRRISRDGTIATMPTEPYTTGATGVAFGRGKDKETLFIADHEGLLSLDPATLHGTRITRFPAPRQVPPFSKAPIDGDLLIGQPFGIAAYNDQEVVFSDVHDSAVKYLRGTFYLRYLGRTPDEEAANFGGSAAWTPAGASYVEPMGVALEPDGTTVVADTGNRRIVAISPLDRHHGYRLEQLDEITYGDSDYRIDFVGASWLSYTTNFDMSISGIVQSQLVQPFRAIGKRPRAEYFLLGSAAAERDMVTQVLSGGAADLVVVFVSAFEGEIPYGVTHPGVDGWVGPLALDLRAESDAMKKAGIPLVFVAMPRAEDVSPVETLDLFETLNAQPSDYVATEKRVLTALAGLPNPVLDLWPIFRAEEVKPSRIPLYASSDIHLTPYGRRVVGDALAKFLQAQRPWAYPNAVR